MKTKRKLSYYLIDDLKEIFKTESLSELVRIALVVLSRMPEPVCWVAGPITSGPLKSEENRKRLRDTIERFKIKGVTILNHLPLQKQATKILHMEFGDRKLSEAEENKLQERLRDELYAPIFRSGKIECLCLMPHSEFSLNVQWKRGFAHARGIPIKHIPEEFIPK